MVGRDEEIEELMMIGEGDRSSLVVVYGRRRTWIACISRRPANWFRSSGVCLSRCSGVPNLTSDLSPPWGSRLAG